MNFFWLYVICFAGVYLFFAKDGGMSRVFTSNWFFEIFHVWWISMIPALLLGLLFDVIEPESASSSDMNNTCWDNRGSYDC